MSAGVNQTVPGGVTRPAVLCTARRAPGAGPTGPTQQVWMDCGRSAPDGCDRAACEEGAGGTGAGGAVTMASLSKPRPGQPVEHLACREQAGSRPRQQLPSRQLSEARRELGE